MKFDKSRVYTAVNADELKVGSKCLFADTLAELRALVQECEGYSKSELREIREDDEVYRLVDKVGHTSALAYLLLSPDEPKYKPFESVDKAREAINKHGGWVSHRDCKNYFFITGYLPHLNEGIGICIGLVWHTLQELYDNFIFADDGSPCGELIEE